MGSLRGIDSYGQDMYYETKGGIWMPKVEKQTKSVAKTTTKALVPLTKQQPPLPSMREVINRQYGRPIVDLGFNYTDLSAQQANAPAANGQKLTGCTPKSTEVPITRADRLLGTGTPARTVNVFKYHNGQYFVLENGKTIGLYNDFSEFNKAVSKLRGQGVKISSEMPYAQTVGDAPRVYNMESKASVANGQKLLGSTPKAAEAPAANAQKLIGSTPQATKYSAVFPSANAAEYGKMLAENPINWNPALVPTKGNTAQAAANKKPASKAQSRYSNSVIQEKVDVYRKAMEKQGLKGQQLEEQVARYKEGLLAERRKHFNKLKGQLKAKNIAKERAQGKLKVQPKKTGAFTKIGKFFKGKGGKATAIGLGIAALGAGLYALLGGKDKKVEETPDINDPELLIAVPQEDSTETVDEVPAEEDIVETTPAEETPAEEVPTEPAYQPIVQLNEDGSYTTKQGDNFFKLAENLLKDYCQENGIDKEIKNTSPEVKYLAEQIMTDNKYWYDFSYSDDRKRPSAPMLHPNVTLIIPEIKQFIEKKVDMAA